MAVGDDDPIDKALEWLDEGRRVAVATVVDTWGSSPRPRGAQLVVRDDGLFFGSVSGGCVEAKVVEAAHAAMDARAHRLLEFGVSNEQAWEVGLACGGTVRIFVEPVLDRAVLEAIRAAKEAQRAIAVLTPLDGRASSTWSPGAASLDASLHAAAERALLTDDAMSVETAAGTVFVRAVNPKLALVIVGAVHIAEPLSRIASLLGYAVTLIDPREAFARKERWPGVTVATDWPDEVLGGMTIGRRTAIVALTHDPKIDDPALEAALRSEAFYVGALGSTKTHAARLHRLAARGFAPDALARIRGPVGLAIGARSPAEIAVSIMAQMTEALRRGPSSAAS